MVRPQSIRRKLREDLNNETDEDVRVEILADKEEKGDWAKLLDSRILFSFSYL